jgi:cytochrome c oxidase assembly protein subunit 15
VTTSGLVVAVAADLHSTTDAGSDPALLSRLGLLSSHLVVALVALVGIGGATRVMEAGLACPDWPLCYGQLLPGRQMNGQVFLEWFHRLDAFVVGVALLVLTGASLVFRRRLPSWLPWCAAGALALVAVQGALGALTVTQLLAAPLVTAHLATALVLVALCSGLYQMLAMVGSSLAAPPLWWRLLAAMALVLVFAQCLLGGSMASQWAADQCFSQANGCAWLSAHRQVAMPASLAVLALAATTPLLPRGLGPLPALTLSAAGLVALQVALGVWTLKLQLQTPMVTVGHQLVAALLVGALAAVLARSLGRSVPAAPLAQVRAEVIHG